jgi:hypothetical protein
MGWDQVLGFRFWTAVDLMPLNPCPRKQGKSLLLTDVQKAHHGAAGVPEGIVCPSIELYKFIP